MATIDSKQPARDFLSFVNASPTRKERPIPFALGTYFTPDLTLYPSLPCCPICKGAAC